MQRLQGRSLGWVVLLIAGAALAGGLVPAAAQDPCPGFQFVPAQGWSCPAPGGWLVQFADGSWMPTHGPDPIPPFPEEDLGALAVPSDPVCVANPASDYYQHVVYAVPSDRANRYTSLLTQIRDLTRTANGMLNEAGMESGGVVANYKVHCTSGLITVANEQLPTSQASTSYSSIVNDLRARGYSSSRAAYWVWFDGFVSGACGQGTLYGDSSLSGGNANNNGNDFALFYGPTSGCTASRTWMHENAHTTGAAQSGAPGSSNAGHCNDGKDILCYQDGGSGQCNTGGFYCENTCLDFAHYDCQHNTYFHTSPAGGSWLATHWNLGNPLNRFFSFAPPGNQAPSMGAPACAPNPSTAGQTVTCTFSATDDSSGVSYQVSWGDGSPATRVPASGTVAPGTQQSAQHAWGANGGYTVSVTATDNDATPRTSLPGTLLQNVGPVCALDRTGSILVGLAGVEVNGFSSRIELIPAACVGRTYTLDGESIFGTPADFDVCWQTSAGADIRCDRAVGADTGVIPAGTAQAQVVLFMGQFGTYTLRVPT